MNDNDSGGRRGRGRHGPPTPAKRLGKAERARMTRIARGDASEVRPAVRGEAIARLAGRADSADVLEEVAASVLDDPAVRSAAIAALARLPAGNAEPRLLRIAAAEDPLIRIKALRALAAVGSAAAYDAIEDANGDEHVARQARFARAVIAYRLDLDDDPLGGVTVPGRRRPSGALAEVGLRPLAAGETATALDATSGSWYGLRPSRAVGFELSIAGAVWFIAVDRSAVRRGELRPARDRKQVLAVLAQRSEETGEYATQHVALAAPLASGALRLVVMRADGEVIHVGTLGIGEKGVAFTTSSATHKGASPTTLAGTVSAGMAELATAIASSSRRSTRAVRPLRRRR